MFKKLSITIAMMATICNIVSGLHTVSQNVYVRIDNDYAYTSIEYVYKTPMGFKGGRIPIEEDYRHVKNMTKYYIEELLE